MNTGFISVANSRLRNFSLRTFLVLIGLITVLFFILPISIQAEEATTNFNQGNKFYEQGDFFKAATSYENMIQSGVSSAPVFFNLGNAYLKSGQLGRSILAYRAAEKFAPRDPDVRANLRFARDQAGGGTHRLSVWRNGISRFTLNEWTVTTALVVAVFFLLLAARKISTERKKNFRVSLWVLGAVGGVLAMCLGFAVQQEFLVKTAVVVVPEAVVRRGPLDESQSVFTLRDGAEITFVDQKGDWIYVEDSAGRMGWLPQRQTMSEVDFVTRTKQ